MENIRRVKKGDRIFQKTRLLISLHPSKHHTKLQAAWAGGQRERAAWGKRSRHKTSASGFCKSSILFSEQYLPEDAPDPRKSPNAKLRALSLSPFLSLQTHLKDYCFIMALTPVRMGISHLKGPSLRNSHPRPGLVQSGPRQDKPNAWPHCLGKLLGVPFRTCTHSS